MAKPIVDRVGLNAEQHDLIQRFEADYNAVDQFLRRDSDSEKYIPFERLVREYSRKHAGWQDAELLKTIARVRNAIVHGKTEAYRYVAVPTSEIAESLRDCRDRLINPPRVIPTFERDVEQVAIGDSLGDVLRIIAKRDYSQFPVYEAERFRGLLTENGITRWLADHAGGSLSSVDLDEVSVKELISNEAERKNHHFASEDTRVDDVSGLFATHALMEAVLITATGRESEALLGIATRWDIVQLA